MIDHLDNKSICEILNKILCDICNQLENNSVASVLQQSGQSGEGQKDDKTI